MRPVSFQTTVNLDFDWEYPDPPRINYELLRIEEYLENTQGLATAAKEIARVEMAQRFEREVDPDGRPWVPLVKEASNQVGILRLTTDMYEDAISEEAWTATPVGVFFDTSVLPDYWAYHEQPFTEGSAAIIESDRGNRIPQRRFIGLSEKAERQIEGAADVWLMGGISGSGRGLAGRFVPLK